MIQKLYADSPNEKSVARVCDTLRDGGVVIYPTDSVYAWGCSIKSVKGVEKLKALTGKSESELTLVCESISQVADYVKVDNETFKLLKRNTPKPITFVLAASNKVPDKVLERRKTIGVRIPDNVIARLLVEGLGAPMLSASVKTDDDDMEYTTDPELIHEMFGSKADLVVDGGICDHVPTTLVDLSGDEIEVLREGRAEVEF